jgi:hypothetical protein
LGYSRNQPCCGTVVCKRHFISRREVSAAPSFSLPPRPAALPSCADTPTNSAHKSGARCWSLSSAVDVSAAASPPGCSQRPFVTSQTEKARRSGSSRAGQGWAAASSRSCTCHPHRPGTWPHRLRT